MGLRERKLVTEKLVVGSVHIDYSMFGLLQREDKTAILILSKMFTGISDWRDQIRQG